jgi:hypothetical protein
MKDEVSASLLVALGAGNASLEMLDYFSLKKRYIISEINKK